MSQESAVGTRLQAPARIPFVFIFFRQVCVSLVVEDEVRVHIDVEAQIQFVLLLLDFRECHFLTYCVTGPYST